MSAHESAGASRLNVSVAEWMRSSGIQERNGGVARYYLSDRQENKPLSTEITGYFASGLVALYEQSGDTKHLEAALEAAVYLTKAWDSQSASMPFEAEGDDAKYSYFFDTGIIVRGLLAVWRKCRREDILSTAVKCGDSLANDFDSGKDFSPIIDLPDKKALDHDNARWSRSPGCYQLKSALAWLELWEITHERRHLDLYRRLLTASLESHSSFLPGCNLETGVMDRLHAYSYFLEGLLPTLDEPACRDTMQTGIERLAMCANNIGAKFLRSDVVAQLLRLRLFADRAGIVSLDPKTCRREAGTIREFQSSDADPRLKGGFWFGKKSADILPFMNPVSTVFCYQALHMWDAYENGDRRLQWQSLI
ncbi:MAG TPA: hypothetical protein VI386_14665 [Candidatus Sulfotelmatobacter sp.]